ncbi:recombinase family protein [Nocardioides endophyticus]|uniref:Recombinase family protein n=1 Tax=Nocardioides endophyticus TaxID=1353775 RepID=A0ABP8YG68_9ACTN
MSTPLNVSLYVRLSEDERGTQLGVARQEQACRELAEAKGWTVRDVFVDNDLSATTGVRRPEFERLLSSKPDAILCWHTDRLVRLSRELERVIDLGVNVHAVQTGHLDLSTPAGRAVAKTVTAWAQYEGEQKAERQKLAAKQRAQAGKPWWPTRPFGLNIDGTLHPDEAPALKKAYEELLNGYTLARVSRELAEGGFTTNKGNPWKAASLRPVLLNARNAAIRVYNGVEVGKAAWDAIVPETTYRAVVRLLNHPDRRSNGGAGGKGRRTNLLTGFATCDKCGATVRGGWRGTAGDENAYRVYECSGRHCVSHPAEWVDSVVTRVVIERVETWADVLATGDSASDVAAAELRIEEKALQSRRAELGELFASGRVGVETLTAGVQAAEHRLSEIADLSAQRAANAFSVDLYDVEALWLWADDVDKFRPVVERVCLGIRLKQRGKGYRGMPRYPEHLEIDLKPLPKVVELSYQPPALPESARQVWTDARHEVAKS